MADPGFPRGGGANSRGGRQHTVLPNFPKNCMKLKEFGLRGAGGGASLAPPLDPPLLVELEEILSKVLRKETIHIISVQPISEIRAPKSIH